MTYAQGRRHRSVLHPRGATTETIHKARPRKSAIRATCASCRPRGIFTSRHCERSEAIHRAAKQVWIASSQGLLAMTVRLLRRGADRRTAGRTVQEGDRYERANP